MARGQNVGFGKMKVWLTRDAAARITPFEDATSEPIMRFLRKVENKLRA